MRCWNSWNLVRMRSTGCASLPHHQGRQRKPRDLLFPSACTGGTGTEYTSQPITPCQELSWLGMLKGIVAFRQSRNVAAHMLCRRQECRCEV